jgi:hypothetical protein
MGRGNPLSEPSGNLKAIHADTKEPTGFENLTDSSLTWSDSGPDRTLTIDKSVDEWSFYVQGVKFTKTDPESIQIPDTEGLHFIYYDTSGVLQTTTVFTNAIITDYAFIAAISWDATNSKGKVWEERHGIVMDGITHIYLHETIGLAYRNGLSLSDFLIGDGSLDSHAQFSSALGLVSDEDVDHQISAVGPTIGHEIWYLDGANWRWESVAGFSVKNFGAGRLAFNDSGSQTEVGNNNFVLCHIFATALDDKKLIAIQGQEEYQTISQAREGALNEISTLQLSGLPGLEMRYIAAVIFKTSNTYGNTVKAKIELTDEGENYVDFRSANVSRVSSGTDHGTLSGLDSDDHLQYELLSGRISDLTVVNVPTYTYLSSDIRLHITYTSTGPVTITIPSALIASRGKFKLKDASDNAGINNITVNTEGAETIDGSSNYVINMDSDSLILYSDGSNLFIE